MSLRAVVGLFLASAALVIASPASAHHVAHESRHTLHPRWSKLDRVEPHKVFPMRIGLKQSNLDKADDFIHDISDPHSPNYGKHWSSEDVIRAFQPSDDTVTQVRQWLVDHRIADARITHSDNKAWFAFHATAEEAETLLYTEYHEYEDSVTGGIMPSCDAYHVPQHLVDHIDYVTPGIKLLAPPESHKSKRTAVEKRADQLHSHARIMHDLKVEAEAPFNASDLSTCDKNITPACVAALYNITQGTSKHKNNSMGMFESELQFYTQLDLDTFFTNFTRRIPNGTHPVAANIDGGQQSTEDLYEAGEEANLDLMLAYPIIYPQTITLYQVDDFVVQANQNDTYTFGFNTFLDALDGSYCTFKAYNEGGNDPNLDQAYPDPATGGWTGNLMCGVYKPTNVISLSYGGQEADLPISYQKRQCLEYMKLGLQGVSFLFASGDAGVATYPAPYGIDGSTGCLGPNLNVFNPTWPNTCPYVTNVGATKVYPGHSVHGPNPESAVYDPAGHPYHVNFSSGGGFSNVYAAPKYQQSALAHYFKNHDPGYPHYSALVSNANDITALPNITHLVGNTKGIYNRIGRGVPDVAAVGDNIAVYVGGNFSLSGGTSASTPIFAAVINRINEERLAANKSSLGFLNPAMYKNPSMFRDIVNGTNPGCGTEGFRAVEGWDPVTGLGTPNYPTMLEYFMTLP